jgi:hypothetical protein
MIDLWHTFISVHGNKRKLTKESRGHLQSSETRSPNEIWTIGSRKVVGRRSGKSGELGIGKRKKGSANFRHREVRSPEVQRGDLVIGSQRVVDR